MFKTLKPVLFISLVAVVVVTFQNCGTGFQSNLDSNYLELSSVAPTILVSNSPPALTNQNSVNIEFRAQSNIYASIVNINCQLNSEMPAPCAGTFSRQNIPDGDYTLRIVAADSLQNISDSTLIMWRVDATPPLVVFNSAPAAVTGLNSATFNFSGTDNLSGVSVLECALGSEDFATCASPRELTDLTMGEHSFRLRARDVAGNISSVVTHTWRIDQTAPVISVTSGPANVTNSRTASFVFTGTDDGMAITSFECSLDSAAFAACTSPRAYNSLPDGTRTFSLRGRDSAGNLSEPATRSWIVDTVIPTIALTTTTLNPTNQTTATFQFTPSDVGSGVLRTECSLNGAAFTVCTSPATYSGLAAGNRTFAVRAVDNATNVSTVASYSWSIDLVPPTLTIAANVTSPTMATSVTFTLTSADTGGSGIRSVECRLDNANYAPCTSPVSYTSLATGAHVFRARATDNAGNINEQVFNWTINTTVECKNFATLTWTPTTEYTDGSPATDLAGYRILYGESAGNYSTTVTVNGGNTSTYVINNLAIGRDYYFTMRAFTTTGAESANSNEAMLNLPNCQADAQISFGGEKQTIASVLTDL